MTTTLATNYGDYDGHSDATFRNPPCPRERFTHWHTQFPESLWPAYREAYHAAYDRVGQRMIAEARGKWGVA